VGYLVGLVAVAAILVAFFALSGRRPVPPSAPATVAATPEPKVEAKSVAVEPAVRPGFAVQVGAFVHRERAEALSSQLSERHRQLLRVTPAEVRNQTFYRVRFLVETRAEAVALAKSLRRDENLPTWIVAAP
jgi:cell division septation protein DedD